MVNKYLEQFLKMYVLAIVEREPLFMIDTFSF